MLNSSILEDRTAIWVIITGLITRVIAGVFIPPGFDEAYYGVYAMHLDWGYYDHPPAVAVIAGFGRWLTGSHSYLALRAGAIIMFLFSCYLLYEIVKSVFDEQAARISIILFHVTPMFLLGMGAIVVPDTALGFFWLVFLYSLVKLRQTDNKRWFLLSGAAVGLAMLSKYHGVLLIAGLGWCLLFMRGWSKYFKSPFLYAGLLIAIIIFAPNIYWNYLNDWVSYKLQFGKSASGTTLSITKFLQNALAPIGYLLPWNFYFLAGGVIVFLRRKNAEAGFLLPFVLIPVVGFALIGATRQILPHWTLPGYLTAVIFAGGWLSRWNRTRLHRFFEFSGAFVLILLAILILHSTIGIIPIDRKADLTLDGQGWKSVVDYLEMDDRFDKETTFLFTHKWFTGGELAYVAEDRFTVTVFNRDDAHAFPYWLDSEKLTGMDGIFVATERYPEDPRTMFSGYFEGFVRLDDISTYRLSGEAQVFHLWLCKKLRKPFP